MEKFDLSGVSGKSVLGHPKAKRMMADVASGRIKALIFTKLARLARNVRELLDISDHFQEHGADLISLDDSCDTSNPAGRLLFTMIGALAQWEREEISARVAASVPIRARMGKPLGGLPPFGYMWEDKQLKVNPNEAPIVVRAFEIFAECKRLLTTAKRLNQEGYRSRRSRFTRTTVERILRDAVYKGLRRANYARSLGGKKHWKVKPAQEWVTK